MTTDNKHKWECISPGEYDTTYRCSKCGALHTDQADDPSSLIPEFGCPVSTDLKSMTVEELREMEWRADEHADFSGYKIHAVAEEAFDELARRLEEVQQKIVAQQAVVSNALEAISATHFFDDPKSRMQRARAVLQSDDLSALAAHDAELTAKAKAEALEEVGGKVLAKAGRKE